MDPFLLTIKYIFNKCKKTNSDTDFDEFFSNGSSFPEFIAIIYGIDKIPGIVQAKNTFQKISNNTKALSYLGQKNPFFKSYQMDFNNKKDYIPLIQLILNKVYFKINKTIFLKKCNDFLKPFGQNISNFSEFTQYTGFAKLINAVSKGVNNIGNNSLSIDKIIQQLNSLNIPVVINENSFLPMNNDLLIYQALIIIELNENISVNLENNDIQISNTSDSNAEKSNDTNNIDIEQSNIKVDVNVNKEFKTNNDTRDVNELNNDNESEENKTKNNVNNNNNNVNDYNDPKTYNSVKPNNENENKLKDEKSKIKDDENNKKIEFNLDDTANIINEKSNEPIQNIEISSDNQKIINQDDKNNKQDLKANKIIKINDLISDSTKNSEDENSNEIKLNEMKSDSSISSSAFYSSDIFDLQKSSYLNIVNNILQNCNMTGIKMLSDFEQGEVLPNLIEILMNTKIPNILPNPKGYDQLMNNMSALYFISNKDPEFNPRNYMMTKQTDIINLIRYLLKKVIFTKEYVKQMTEETNDILSLYKMNSENFNIDWDDGTKFVALLNTLSKGDIVFPQTDGLDIDKLKDLFVKSNCTSIIENDGMFGNVDEYVILYQVRIILNEIKFRNITISKIESNETEENNNDQTEKTDHEDEYSYIKDSCPIVRLLNVIGKKIGLHYEKLEDIINGNTLYLLVQNIMRVAEIPGIAKDENSNSNNVKTVLNFLSEKNTVFQFSSFNFDDKSTLNTNIIYFINTLLQQYYLKGYKSKLIDKVSECFGKKILLKDLKNVFSFGNGFYKILGHDEVQEKNYYDENAILQCFKDAKVPFILDDESLTNGNEDYICYQLKLIYQNPSNPDYKLFEEPIVDNELENPDQVQILTPEEEMIKSFMDKFQKKKEKENENDSEQMLSNLVTGNALSDILAKFENKLTQEPSKEEKMNKVLEMRSSSQLQIVDQKCIDDFVHNLKPLILNNKLKKIEENSHNNIVKNYEFMKTIDDPNQIVKESDNPDFPLSYNLYSYKPCISESTEIDNNINEKLSNLFKESINEVTKNKSDSISRKYKMKDKHLKTYRLFDCKPNSVVYDEKQFNNFLKENELTTDDILYLILLPPKCITDINTDNDQIYKLIKTITAFQNIDGSSDSDICVEIIYGGNINDIQSRFGINCLKTSNENIAFVQIRYRPILKDDPIISKMQGALTLYANYILTLYPSISIDDSLHFINTSMHHATLSNQFNSRFIGMSFLLKNLPSEIENNLDIIKRPSFGKILDEKINTDKGIFKQIKTQFEFIRTTFQWIDINNYDTYNNFLETMINYCQKNIHYQNQIIQIKNNLEKVCEMILIKDEKEMINFMHKMSNVFDSNKPKQVESLFKSNNKNSDSDSDDKIIFNQDIWENFIKSADLDIKKDLISIILFVNSNPKDVNMIARILSNTVTNYITRSHEFQAELYYCKTVEIAASRFNGKVHSKLAHSHLLLINCINPITSPDEYQLFFETPFAAISNLIITIPSKNSYKEQLSITNKMMNVLNFQYDEKEKKPQLKYLFINYQPTKFEINEMKSMEKEIQNDDMFYELELENEKSNSEFIDFIINNLRNPENLESINEYFNNINIKCNNIFNISIIQCINKGNNNKYTINDEYKKDTINAIKKLFIKNRNHSNNLISISNKFFKELYAQFNKNKTLIKCAYDIKRIAEYEFVKESAKKCINDIISADYKWDEFCSDAENYITDSVTEIDEEYIEMMRDSCNNEICNHIFMEVVKNCSENNISDDTIIVINDIVLDELKDKIENCLSKINVCYEKLYKFDQKEELMNEDEIKQNSMKYILSVKEAIKENTIQLTTENLEFEIPQDF